MTALWSLNQWTHQPTCFTCKTLRPEPQGIWRERKQSPYLILTTLQSLTFSQRDPPDLPGTQERIMSAKYRIKLYKSTVYIQENPGEMMINLLSEKIATTHFYIYTFYFTWLSQILWPRLTKILGHQVTWPGSHTRKQQNQSFVSLSDSDPLLCALWKIVVKWKITSKWKIVVNGCGLAMTIVPSRELGEKRGFWISFSWKYQRRSEQSQAS